MGVGVGSGLGLGAGSGVGDSCTHLEQGRLPESTACCKVIAMGFFIPEQVEL